ncbi:MAG TPA: hypothetical protein VEC93_17905, partial [Anaerolineae bacterium]|nr:hypothetical protein [Anaerolineae bacterium]
MTYLKQNWPNSITLIGVFFLALLLRILRLGEFWGTDERYIWELANRFFIALTEGRLADTFVHGYPAITVMWVEAIAVWNRQAAFWLTGHSVSVEALLGLDTPFAMLSEKQIPLVLTNSLLVAGAFWLTRKICGWHAALIGAVFVAL